MPTETITIPASKVVEGGDARTVLSAPQHPYSRLLRDSVLSPDAAGTDRLDSPPVEAGASEA